MIPALTLIISCYCMIRLAELVVYYDRKNAVLVILAILAMTIIGYSCSEVMVTAYDISTSIENF